MIGIKGMEMPNDCMECNFCNHIKSNDYGTYGDCVILGDNERMNLLLHQKHSDCPLVEIVTCKDCKHWHDDGIITTCDKHIGHGFPRDHFCADAERRE
jgi:hypothetical protein